MNSQHTRTSVWQLARGNWEYIFAQLAPELDEAARRAGRHVSCPVHKGKHGDAFRLMPDFNTDGGGVCNTCGMRPDGINLLAWLKGWQVHEAAREVEHLLQGYRVPVAPVVRREVAPQRAEEDQDAFKVRCLLETMNGTVGLGHESAEPARRYFINRGLVPMRGPLSELRFHPALDYFVRGRGSIGKFPAIVGVVRQSDGERATLHRIYLTPDGHKADLEGTEKKQMPHPSYRSVSGAAIRLDECRGPVLHVAEGVETALAVRIITGEPTWSLINAGNLEVFMPPAHVRMVCLWADLDMESERGQRAANRALANLRKRGVWATVVMPSQMPGAEHVDWLDMLNTYGRDTIVSWNFYRDLGARIQRNAKISQQRRTYAR